MSKSNDNNTVSDLERGTVKDFESEDTALSNQESSRVGSVDIGVQDRETETLSERQVTEKPQAEALSERRVTEEPVKPPNPEDESTRDEDQLTNIERSLNQRIRENNGNVRILQEDLEATNDTQRFIIKTLALNSLINEDVYLVLL